VLGGAALCVIVAGLAVMQDVPQRWLRDRPVATLTMIAVGDGSCFVLQSDGQTLVFDCGSQNYPQIGRRSVVPALRSLGVDRIDLLLLSHADLDHFSGVPDLLDAMPVDRVLGSPGLFTDAADRPEAATAHLLRLLADRSLTPEAVAAGWSARFGYAELNLLWPPLGYVAERSNDHSLLLHIGVPGTAALLHGDLQHEDKFRLLADPASATRLDVDVADLPHHGSFKDDSLRWLDTLTPEIVLQSSGPRRLRRDRWATPIRERRIRRFVTHCDGMTTLRLYADGSRTIDTYLP
jgi:competence protein ComEC